MSVEVDDQRVFWINIENSIVIVIGLKHVYMYLYERGTGEADGLII